MSEFRKVTVLFITLELPKVEPQEEPDSPVDFGAGSTTSSKRGGVGSNAKSKREQRRLSVEAARVEHEALRCIQRCLYRSGNGTLRQFIHDDKGVVAIGLFGLRKNIHQTSSYATRERASERDRAGRRQHSTSVAGMDGLRRSTSVTDVASVDSSNKGMQPRHRLHLQNLQNTGSTMVQPSKLQQITPVKAPAAGDSGDKEGDTNGSTTTHTYAHDNDSATDAHCTLTTDAQWAMSDTASVPSSPPPISHSPTPHITPIRGPSSPLRRSPPKWSRSHDGDDESMLSGSSTAQAIPTPHKLTEYTSTNRQIQTERQQSILTRRLRKYYKYYHSSMRLSLPNIKACVYAVTNDVFLCAHVV
jgi:hypothetical protein